jgi:predicted enzyme related to lactoylglutathione lyase
VTNGTPTYPPGTPSWVDLGSPNPQASAAFYDQLFGWKSEDLGEEFGHYTMFMQDGKRVAAVGPLTMEGQPAAWMTYVATANADETAKKVTDAGGKVLAPPLAVADQGTMAVFADPTGGVFSVWQPAVMGGADLVNTPVSFTWNELATRDVNAAKTFYPKVFGWGIKANPMPDGGEYIEWQVSGKSIAGGMPMSSMYPPQVPPHWLVYFTVANADDTVKRAQEIGGKLTAPAVDTPQGRMAVLTDPNGAAFAVIQASH